jgi:transcriptional regulator with XRE-family HTH domain
MPCLNTIRFGDAMLLLRRRARLSQTDLAQRCRFTPSAISRLEAGRSVPTVDTVERLVRALDAAEEERGWLSQLAAHARLLRCAQREQPHWEGSTSVVALLAQELMTINHPRERSEAPI